MSSHDHAPLRSRAPWRVLDGFGRAFLSAGRVLAPRNAEELAQLVAMVREEGLQLTFRGAGRSYGDASLNTGGVVLDMTHMNKILSWDPQTGILEAEPGVTIEDLWRHTLADGYWPHVVPGTMRPTLGGCISMNVHGKNNFKAGPFGEHVLELELLTSTGERIRCSREKEPEIFRAAIGGMGLLGAVTRIKLSLHKVPGGRLKVQALGTKNLDAMFDLFEQRIAESDYLVGWVDCTSTGSGLGRGEVHQANYQGPDQDPLAQEFFSIDKQGLPSTILGVPRSVLWRFMALFMNNFCVRFVNLAKYLMARIKHGATYMQSHVAFAFLLDYVPNWRNAYGPGGFLQYQIFVPHATARDVMKKVLTHCIERGMPSYLGVFKRHRPDEFLMSHALDGWSLALDFKVVPSRRAELMKMLNELTEIVLQGGGKFYFAKDGVIDMHQVARAYGKDKLAQFAALRARVDPSAVVSSDLSRRALGA